MPTLRLRLGALVVAGLLAPASLTRAQDPDDNSAPRDPSGQSDLVARMMKFDKDKDGKLTRAEITDDRLVRLFTRADANKDGTVTPTELEAVEAAERPASGGFGGPGGPGGGPGGFGGPGGPMGAPPKPGEVLPAMMRTRLKLTTDQQLQLDELQRDVDARMAKILTESQKTQLKQMATMRGPGGGPGGPGGGPGGFGGGPGGGRGGRGPGGPGGPPPGGDDLPPPGAPPERPR